MPIPQRHVEDLQRLYQRRFGRVLSDREASDMAIRLIGLYAILTAPSAKATRTPPPLSPNPRTR